MRDVSGWRVGPGVHGDVRARVVLDERTVRSLRKVSAEPMQARGAALTVAWGERVDGAGVRGVGNDLGGLDAQVHHDEEVIAFIASV